MKKYHVLKPQYITEGVSTPGNLIGLLDTSAMYKSPERVRPKLVALTSDYPDDSKYLVGKKINLDATFTYKLRTTDSSNILWEVTPKDILLEKIIAVKPDPKTIRKTYIPLKEGEVTVKVTFTDSKEIVSTQSITLNIEACDHIPSSLDVTKIISCLFTDTEFDEIEIGEEKEIRIVFDRAVPTNEEVSIITSPNVISKDGLVFAEDRKSATIKIIIKDYGYTYFKVSTTGTPYLGFSDLPLVENPAPLELVSISNPLEVIKGQKVECVLAFNKYLIEEPTDLKITLENENVKEVSRKIDAKTLVITYEGITEGTCNLKAQLGEAGPKEQPITIHKEATTISTAVADKPEVVSGEDLSVNVEFDEYPIKEKVQVVAGTQGSFTKKGDVVIEGKKAKQDLIPNIPGRHKIKISYGESTQDIDVLIKGRVDGKVKTVPKKEVEETK